MGRNIGFGLGSALVVGILSVGCGDGATGPGVPAMDVNLEALALETVGITEDQANGSSVFPLSVGTVVLAVAAGDHGSCTFSGATGRITCPDLTRGGLTISRSYALYDAANTPQPARGPTTVKVNTQVWARGIVATERSKVAIDRKSDLTATGIQITSPSRTLNGTEQGSSTMEHQTSRGKVTSTLVFGDTTINLVLPQGDLTRRWPLSGTVIRSHSGTRTIEGGAGSSPISYRAVFVYDGSNTVKITITANGTTKTCVRNLETRAYSCTP